VVSEANWVHHCRTTFSDIPYIEKLIYASETPGLMKVKMAAKFAKEDTQEKKTRKK